eukprot:5189885-Pleurochrysis_carterae.AAC.1
MQSVQRPRATRTAISVEFTMKQSSSSQGHGQFRLSRNRRGRRFYQKAVRREERRHEIREAEEKQNSTGGLQTCVNNSIYTVKVAQRPQWSSAAFVLRMHTVFTEPVWPLQMRSSAL